MNDFLHSLRNNKDKRFDKNRRNFDSPSYRQNDRTINADRRKKGPYRPQQNEQAQAYAAINKLLPTIKALLESQNEDRKKLIKAEERKAYAMEAIASLLKKLSGGAADGFPLLESIESFCEDDACEAVAEVAARVSEDTGRQDADQEMDTAQDASLAPEESLEDDPRDELVTTIRALRDKGLTYEKIARHLEENQVPTISGRGKWRGQAVSKLCQ
jgi:DNA-binding transcriptional MerR regulator